MGKNNQKIQEGITYIKPCVESWKISGVSCNGKKATYEVIGEMIPVMTQEKQIEKYGEEFSSSELIWGIASRAYELRNKFPEQTESLRKFLYNGFRQYPNTSTRVIYCPEKNDRIIHNYNTENEHILTGKVIGVDGFIQDIPDSKILKPFLGTKSINKINEVSNWINNTNTRLWRLNFKPVAKEERIVRFDADSVRLYLVCYWDPLIGYPGFRVLQVD